MWHDPQQLRHVHPEALGSPSGYVVPTGHRLLRPHAPSESLPAAYGFAAGAAAPKENGLRWESRGSPIYSAGLCSHAASHTPATRRVRLTVSSSSVLAFTPVSRVRRHSWKFRGCRVHSFPSPQELLRPASWLALLSRTFTFELAPTRSPSISVEYDYVDKQSIPTAGLSPASPTALWAAGHRISPGFPFSGKNGELTLDFPSGFPRHRISPGELTPDFPGFQTCLQGVEERSGVISP